MVQITIDWDFISPSLQTVSGIVTVSYVTDTVTVPWKTLAKFRTRVEPGSVGYKSLDENGIRSVVFDAIKPQLDIMVRSYQQGVIMDKRDFTWVMINEINDARDAFLKLPNIGEDVIYESCDDQSKV